MQFGWPRRQKPSIGTQLDRTHPLLSGLVWYAPCWENGGATAVDLIGGNNLTLVSGATWSPGGSPFTGGGILLNTGTATATSGQWPARFQTARGPYSVVCGFRWTGSTPGSYAGIFGLVANNGYGAGSGAIDIGWYGALSHLYALGVESTIALAAKTDYVVVMTVTPGSGTTQNASVYVNGVLAITAAAVSVSNSSWNSTSCVFAGGIPGSGSRASATQFSWGGVYNRALSASEAAEWSFNPWQIFAPSHTIVDLGSIPAGFSVFPATAYSDNSSTFVFSLTGAGTSWSSGSTTFTLSGVSGVTKASQTVNSATSATIVLTTGASTGTLTISDGTYTHTIAVLGASFTVSPTSIAANQSGTMTLTGTGTSWSAGTVFSISGLAGAAISSQTVNSATSATIVFTSGGVPGTLVVSDGVVTASVTLTSYFTASATTIPISNSTGTTITLTGTGTSWSGGTVFSISGLAGTAISLQTVTSATSATIVLTTGATVGTIALTDGVSSTTIAVPAILIASYVSKCGATAFAFAQANTQSSVAITGTVSANRNSSSLTSSSPQAAWIGKQIRIAGDSTATAYTITAGYATSWTISPPYAGSANAANATQRSLRRIPCPPSSRSRRRRVFGSVRWCRDRPSAYLLGASLAPDKPEFSLCRVATAVRPGCLGRHSEPRIWLYQHADSVGIRWRRSGLALGTPLMTGGVTSYNVVGGSGYTSAPRRLRSQARRSRSPAHSRLGRPLSRASPAQVGSFPA